MPVRTHFSGCVVSLTHSLGPVPLLWFRIANALALVVVRSSRDITAQFEGGEQDFIGPFPAMFPPQLGRTEIRGKLKGFIGNGTSTKYPFHGSPPHLILVPWPHTRIFANGSHAREA